MSIWNLIKLRHHSLTRQYLYFTITVISLVLTSTFWVSYSNYKNYVHENELYLVREAQKLQIVFDEQLVFIESFLQFLGTKIINEETNIDKIASIIKHHPNNFKDDAFGWHLICFVDENFKVVADSIRGTVAPFLFDIEKRNWIQSAQSTPWKLLFSPPDIGYITKDYVLPAGISVFNKNENKIIGYLAAGISIAKFTHRLLQVQSENTNFIIVGRDGDVIISSEPDIDTKIMIDPVLLGHKNGGNIVTKFMDEIHYGNHYFTHSLHSSRYPFTILIGYDRNIYNNKIKQELIPNILIYVLLGTMFVSILHFLGYQVIKPILELGKVADDISKSKKFRIPKYKAKELNILAQQLKNISMITTNLRKKKNQLSKANEKLSYANEFIRNNMSFLSHELTNPTSSIIGFAKLLKQRVLKLSDKSLYEPVDMLYKTAMYQGKQLNFFLKLFQFQNAKRPPERKEINLRELIEWNVSMVRHHAKKKNVKIDIQVEVGLKMVGDEIMLGQLVQNLASNGAKYNKTGGKLTIKAFYSDRDKVVIEFIDTGIGIAKRNINKIFKKFIRISPKEAVGYGIGLACAKEYIDAHKGIIEIDSKLGRGSIFRLTFPRHLYQRKPPKKGLKG